MGFVSFPLVSNRFCLEETLQWSTGNHGFVQRFENLALNCGTLNFQSSAGPKSCRHDLHSDKEAYEHIFDMIGDNALTLVCG